MEAELQKLYAALDEALSHEMGPPMCPSVEQVQKHFAAKVLGVRLEGDYLIIDLEVPPIKYIKMTFIIEEDTSGDTSRVSTEPTQ